MNIRIIGGKILNVECLPSLGLDEHEVVHVNNFRDFVIDCVD